MCQGTPWRISSAAAKVANALWEGPRDASGKQLWYGLLEGAAFFNASDPILPGIVGTACQGRTCSGAPFPITSAWMQLFVLQDPNFDLAEMSHEQYFDILYHSFEKYNDIMGSAEPDLTAFRARGGKLISWHGLADQVIMPDGTADYYERVMDLFPDVANFYRHFEAPGVAHCRNGPGPLPLDTLGAVVKWVEEGIAPDVLEAISQNGDETKRLLCPYPQQQQYMGSGFRCVAPAEHFGNVID